MALGDDAGILVVEGAVSLPYDAKMVTAILRTLPAEKLAASQPHDFQRHPAPIILRGQIIAEMIANERARRKA